MEKEIIDAARKYIANGEPIRHTAVFAVDDFHGFTMEFSSTPKAHEAEYDELEELLNPATP